MLLVTFAASALATETAQMTISASRSSTKPGDTVTFTISISQVDDCCSAGIVISYDPSVFEYVSGKCLASGAATQTISTSGSHTLGSCEKLDGSTHTRTCTGCGATKTGTIPATGEHTYDHGCDADCNACGVVQEPAHTYGDGWSVDESGHWHGCTVCASHRTEEATDLSPAVQTALIALAAGMVVGYFIPRKKD